MDLESDVLLGRFPTVTVDMDTPIQLGASLTITMSVNVKEIRHEQVDGMIRRIHVFAVDSMRMALPDEALDEPEVVCCQCEMVGYEDQGAWVGERWVCRGCIEKAAPWIHSNEAVLLPTPHGDLDED